MAARGPVKLYFDGGARPNPGRMESAVVLRGKAHIDRDLGMGSGADAEWLALIAALRLAQAEGLGSFVLLGDALAVINQANGLAPARGRAVDHLASFRALVAGAAPPRIRHIGRAQNLAGIALARLHPR